MVGNYLNIFVRVYFWTFHSIPFVYISALFLVQHWFYYHSFVISFEIMKYRIFNLVLFFCIYFWIFRDLLRFHRDFYISAKNAIATLIGIALNLYISLDSLGTLKTLNLLTQEYRMHFPFICVSLIS